MRGRLTDVAADRDRPAIAEALKAVTSGQGQIPPVDATMPGDKGRSARFFVSPWRRAPATAKSR